MYSGVGKKVCHLGNLFLCDKHTCTSKDYLPSSRSLEMSRHWAFVLGLALKGAGVSYCGVWPSGLHALWLTSSGIGHCVCVTGPQLHNT